MDDQQKIQELTTQVTNLTKDKATLATQNETLGREKVALTTQVQTLTKDKETLATQVKTLTDAKTKAGSDLFQALDVIKDLKEQLAEQASGVVKTPTIKIGELEYEFLSEFHYGGEDITLERLKEDAQLAAKLVKEGVGDLRRVVAKKA